MTTWSLNSSACSAAKTAWIGWGVFAALAAFPALSFADLEHAAVPTPSSLISQLHARHDSGFDRILKDWEERYGTRAVQPLAHLASDPTLPDSDRYIALMASAKLGGPATAVLWVPYLKDRSWMLRSAALKVLSALDYRKASDSVLKLVRDPALVVRLQAVEAVEKLKPAGAADALIQAAFDPENYHGGKPLWVPQRALTALAVTANPQDAATLGPRLMPLLDRDQDELLQKRTIAVLETLYGPQVSAQVEKGAGLQATLRSWKEKLKTSL